MFSYLVLLVSPVILTIFVFLALWSLKEDGRGAYNLYPVVILYIIEWSFLFFFLYIRVCILQANLEEEENSKVFLILNEIILTLKDVSI